MPATHDQPSGSLAGASGIEVPTQIGNFDPLSDVLRTVKLQGALFFMIEATSPWCIEVPHAKEYAEIILPRAQHVVSYHLVVEGHGVAGVRGNQTLEFETGDVIVFPHVDPYFMASGCDAKPSYTHEENLQFFREAAAGNLPFVMPEGGGAPPKTRLICGFLGCDLSPFNPLFATLPSILRISRPGDGKPDLLDQLIDLAMAEIHAPRAGAESIRLSLCELMFVELLRRQLRTTSESRPGWLAGLQDPIVGRALSFLHASPAEEWNLGSLAAETGVSRSVLAERFALNVGEPPMRYLLLWRMQLAARLLVDSPSKVSTVAAQVGFRSEAAFSRAFKRVTGFSPSEWRRSATIV